MKTGSKQKASDRNSAGETCDNIKQLLAAIHSILIGLDDSFRITYWNTVAESFFGLKASELIGEPISKLPDHFDWSQVQGALRNARKSGKKEYILELPCQDQSGDERFITYTIQPLAEQSDGRSAYLIAGEDVTERKKLEAQLTQAQKLESIGQLAAGIAHEINTPTQYIGDNIRFVKDSFDQINELIALCKHRITEATTVDHLVGIQKEIDDCARRIDLDYLIDEIPTALNDSLDGVARVSKIVQAMRSFSHIQDDEMMDIDINQSIENTVTIARNEYKYVADLELDLCPNLPLIPCLPNELNQVILNLIINASHAIADVVKDSGTKGKITIRTTKNEQFVKIAVRDTGSGIPVEVQSKIFDPFFTTKEVGKGTGQGLSISHHVIVEKHQGIIRFETQPGAGTTFYIELPLTRPEDTEATH